MLIVSPSVEHDRTAAVAKINGGSDRRADHGRRQAA